MPRVKTIVITRPRQDAIAMAKALKQYGVKPFIEPLLTIEQIHNDQALKKALDKQPAAILVTSRHALVNVARIKKALRIPLLAVGTSTAEQAKALGFTSVAVAGGTVGTLVTHAKRHYETGSKLLYLRAEMVSADIAASLEKRFELDEIIAYRARAARSFSAALRKSLTERRVDSVVFFSLRSAETYSALVKKYGLAKAHDTVEAIAMSRAIAKGFGTLCWKKIRIAKEPTLQGVMRAIKQSVC